MRYIGDGQPWPEDRARAFVERQIATLAAHAFCLWKLTTKNDGELIGFCGLQPLPETDDIEIGWWLARVHWGQGLATEAASAAMRDGFQRAALQRIVAIAQPANVASIAVMHKLGMLFVRMSESSGISVVLYARTAGPLATLR